GRRQVEGFGHRQVEHVRVRQVGHAEAEPARLARGDSPALRAGYLDAAVVGGEKPAGDPQQRRLPGPVLPDERVDLPGAALDADVPNRLHCAERLRDAAESEHVRAHVSARPISGAGPGKAARGGNSVSPTRANLIRATLVGARLDTV